MIHHVPFFLKMRLLLVLLLVVSYQSARSQEGMYQKFLEYRLKSDSEYKAFQLELDIADTELKKAKNASLASLELGVSESGFSLSKEKSRTGYSFRPYINFSLPMYNNTGMKMSLPISKMGDAKTNAFNMSVFTEVYGITRKSKQLELMAVQEKRDKALKNCKLAAQYVEKKFLKELKEVFTLYSQTLEKKLKEAQAEIAYEQLKVQGYADVSTKMRTGKLDLLATQRDLKEADFAFQTKYNKFLSACGVSLSEVRVDDENRLNKETVGEGENGDIASSSASESAKPQDKVFSHSSSTPVSGIPLFTIEELLASILDSIPKMELIKLDGFGAENYVQFADAKKAYEMKKKRGELAVHPLTVTAETGISHSKKSLPSTVPTIQTQETTEQSFSAGVGFKLPGTKILAGLDFPFDEKRRGDVQFKFGFAINPIEIWNYTLEKKNVAINDEIERLKLQDKIDAFDLVWNELNSKRNFIEWQNKMAEEQLGIYQENKKEYEMWLKRGVIGKSEKQRADIEYEKARVRQLDAIIGINSFNIETRLLFEEK